jgi:hypothetical protein
VLALQPPLPPPTPARPACPRAGGWRCPLPFGVRISRSRPGRPGVKTRFFHPPPLWPVCAFDPSCKNSFCCQATLLQVLHFCRCYVFASATLLHPLRFCCYTFVGATFLLLHSCSSQTSGNQQLPQPATFLATLLHFQTPVRRKEIPGSSTALRPLLRFRRCYVFASATLLLLHFCRCYVFVAALLAFTNIGRPATSAIYYVFGYVFASPAPPPKKRNSRFSSTAGGSRLLTACPLPGSRSRAPPPPELRLTST